jgi:hypothetical protein
MTTDSKRDGAQETPQVEVHSAAPADKKTGDQTAGTEDEIAEEIEEQGTVHVPLGT